METKTSKHTPTPWSEGEDGDLCGADGKPIPAENEEANKAFMLRAVNSYEQDQEVIKGLVEAAKHMVIASHHANTRLSPSGNAAVRMLEAAIEKAKAEGR